jgi:hypothetical protein
MPVIPAPQEAEIRRIEVRNQPGQNSSQNLILKKNPVQKKAGEVAPGIRPWIQAPAPHTHTQKVKHLLCPYSVSKCLLLTSKLTTLLY